MDLGEILTSAPGLTAAATAACAAGVYVYAAKIETRKFSLERPPAITAGGTSNQPTRSLKVLHLSDIHFSAPETHKLDFLKSLPWNEFDLVFITGDIFENESGLQYAPYLLGARPRHGAFAVLGNHDYFRYSWLNKTYGRMDRRFRHPKQKRDVEPFVAALSAAGVQTLRNESIHLEAADARVIGVDYPATSDKKWKELTTGIAASTLVLALQHVPKRLNQIVDHGVHVAFAGHTHGGQVRLPGIGALVTDSDLPTSEASGMIKRGNTFIHVSRGLSADPKTNFRLFCPPVATVVEIIY